MFSAIGNFFGWLTGSGAEGILTTATNAISAFNYTDKEQDAVRSKMFDQFIAYQQASLPQNVARRIIGFGVAGFYLFWSSIALICHPFAPQYAQYIFMVLKDTMQTPFSIIMSFYFASGFIDKWSKR